MPELMRYPKSFVATSDKMSSMTQLRVLSRTSVLSESVCSSCESVTYVCYFLRHVCEGDEANDRKKGTEVRLTGRWYEHRQTDRHGIINYKHN